MFGSYLLGVIYFDVAQRRDESSRGDTNCLSYIPLENNKPLARVHVACLLLPTSTCLFHRSIDRLHLYIFMNIFCFEFELLKVQPCWSTHSQLRAEKGWHVTYLILLPTHSGLVHGVTDTDSWSQNSSTHSRIFATIKRRFLTDRTKNRAKIFSAFNLFLLHSYR